MIEWQLEQPISLYCTLGIGGTAKRLALIHSEEQMKEAILELQTLNIPFLILGKGSNSLIKGKRYDGAVLINKIGGFKEISTGLFEAGAGYSFSLLGVQTAKLGFAGLEFASGIPATVGGAVFMNAGANGTETADTLAYVDCLDLSGKPHHFKRAELHFSYRSSSFQKQNLIITKAAFQLTKSADARTKQLQIIDYRLNTQPYKDKSCGCVFRNPSAETCKVANQPPLSAGALIEQCGLKGLQIGGAKVSDKHANFIINENHATDEDYLALIEFVRLKVEEKTAVRLETEVRILPQ